MYSYLEEISKNIKNKTAKKAVIAELESHIEDKKDYYIEIGYSAEEAEKKAIEEMGEAEQTALSLNELYTVKWYKNTFNIVSFIILLLCIAGSYIVSNNSYYLNSIEAQHNLIIDFLSLGIFTAYVILFALSVKFNNKFFPAVYLIYTILILLVISIAPDFAPVSINEEYYAYFDPLNSILIEYIKPLIYAIVVLFTKGFFEYSASLHGYDYAELILHEDFQWAVILIWALLVFWAFFIVLKILCKERMLYTGIFKLLINIIKYPVVVFCVLVIVLTSSATVYSYLNRDKVIEENNELHKSLIDYVIGADISKSSKELSEDFIKQDLSLKKLTDTYLDNSEDEYEYYFQKYNNQLQISANTGERISSRQYKYRTDLIYTRYPNISYYNDDYNLIEVADEKEIKKFKPPYKTLKEFLKSDKRYNAVCVIKGSPTSNEDEEHINLTFYFSVKGKLVPICFKDGVNVEYDEEEGGAYILSDF